MHQLRYGKSSILDMEVAPHALVADCTQVPGRVIDDLAAAVAAALVDPLGYPPLTRAVVPGDRVVVALDPDVPCAAELTAGIVHALFDAEVSADHITILQAPGGSGGKKFFTQLPPEAEQLQVVVHDPQDPSQLAYLAASQEAVPIMLNRVLCDADFVIPVNLLRPEGSIGFMGAHGGLCPTFCDAATQERFRAPQSAIQERKKQRRRAEADEVAWLLGIQLTLQIIAGPGDTVLHVLAGQVDDVYRQGRALVEAAWSHRVPTKAQFVVATIEGGRDDQTWENFGRALHAAQQVCAEKGTIVLCTEMTCRPGPSLKRLASFEENEKLIKRVRRDRSRDALPASLLLESRDSAHVYLLSGLDVATVEAIGIGYIDAPEHIGRLSRQCDSCILLSNAHRVALRPGD